MKFRKFYYRIVQVDTSEYVIQFRRWYSPFWQELTTWFDLQKAKRSVKLMKKLDKLPKVIRSD